MIFGTQFGASELLFSPLETRNDNTHTHIFIVGVSDERQGGRDGEREGGRREKERGVIFCIGVVRGKVERWG